MTLWRLVGALVVILFILVWRADSAAETPTVEPASPPGTTGSTVPLPMPLEWAMPTDLSAFDLSAFDLSAFDLTAFAPPERARSAPTYPAPPPRYSVEAHGVTLEKVAMCESGGDYTVVNRQGSTASGKYQILDSTWRSWSVKSGVPGATDYARAKDAPPDIQDAVASWAFEQAGTQPWLASRSCWNH
jgi:hypothetical protein